MTLLTILAVLIILAGIGAGIYFLVFNKTMEPYMQSIECNYVAGGTCSIRADNGQIAAGWNRLGGMFSGGSTSYNPVEGIAPEGCDTGYQRWVIKKEDIKENEPMEIKIQLDKETTIKSIALRLWNFAPTSALAINGTVYTIPKPQALVDAGVDTQNGYSGMYIMTLNNPLKTDNITISGFDGVSGAYVSLQQMRFFENALSDSAQLDEFEEQPSGYIFPEDARMIKVGNKATSTEGDGEDQLNFEWSEEDATWSQM